MYTQKVDLKAVGLHTFPNALSLPPGALQQADNVIINRDNTIESCRGFAVYGNEMGSSPTNDLARQLFSYKNIIFRHYGSNGGTTIEYDSNGQGDFDAFAGTFAPVNNTIRIKYAEANSNLYFTTSTGIKRVSISDPNQLTANSVVNAGMPQGLDITLGLNSQQGFFNQESAVSYRTLWGIKDANQNLIAGAPSNREIIYNPLTPLLSTDFNALLTVLDTCGVPTGIHYGSYHSTFNVTGTSSTQLRNNLIAVATQLDTDIESFTAAANVTGITGTTSTSSNNITSITTTGIKVGQLVTGSTSQTADLTGGTTSTSSSTLTFGSVSGVAAGQIVTCVSAGVLPDNTLVVSTTGTTVVLNTVPLLSGTYEYKFLNPNPIPANTTVTAVGGSTVTLSNTPTFSGTYTFGANSPGFNFSSVYSQQNVGASTYATTYVLTADPTPIFQVNDPVKVIGVVPSTFNTTTATVQSLNSSSVTVTVAANPGVYISGTAIISRYKYEAITQPLTLDSDPTTNELLSMQVYYDAIVDFLQVEPAAIVATPTIFDNSNSTQTATVDITFPIPQTITTNHYFQIYRSDQVQGSIGISLDTLDPGDELFLAYEGNPTPTDITNGYITVQDITPDSFLGASLYTNANSGTGITSASYPPPLAEDLTLYYNYLCFANTVSKHSINISLLGVGSLVNNVSTLTVTNGATSNTYTFTTSAEDPATQKIHISSLPTPSQQINETARSIVNVINRNPNELVYAFYQSGTTGVPGQILLQSRTLGTPAFYLNVDATGTGSDFNPVIPVSGQANISDNDVRPNRVYYSTQFQPDAVPLVNFFDVGPRDKKILRIVALRQSLYIIKEEGIYQASGNVAPFVLNLFDSSTILRSADSAAVLNNQIYGLANQGVVVINDTGVNIISRPIEGSLVKLNNTQYPNFISSTFGVGYESDRTYNLWTVTNRTDVNASQCFVYNTITQAWTRKTKGASCGIVHSDDDKLYIGASDINFIEQERKSFDRTDYANRQFSFNLGSGSVIGDVVILGSLTNVSAGDVLLQTQYLTIEQFNRLISKLSNDAGLHNNYLSLTASPGVNLRTEMTSLAELLDSDSGTNTKTYASSISGYTDSFPDTQSAFNVIIGLLNNDTGTKFKNYKTSTGTIDYEVVITATTNFNNSVTTEFAYPFIQGNIIAFNHINCAVKWAPETFGDPSLSKQVAEATMMFEKMSFTDATISFDTDLNPSTIAQDFPGLGNGSYGSAIYGSTIFGDSGNAVPLRTLVPRDMQRCRYLNVSFNHSTAREVFAIFGISLTSNSVSQRAWR